MDDSQASPLEIQFCACRKLNTSSIPTGHHDHQLCTFIMPFQLSPVATRNKVRKAIPKFLKWACSPSPWHGYSSSHSEKDELKNIFPGYLIIKLCNRVCKGLLHFSPHLFSPSLPNSSTPRAAKMKNNRKNSNPRLPTCGSACMTVSSSARIPLAIFSSLSTVWLLRD